MASGGAQIGRGGVLLAATSPASPAEQLLRLRYEVTTNGIQFFRQPTVRTETVNRRDPINIFEALDTLLADQNSVLQSRNGHLVLVALPATPDAAFYNVTLSVVSGTSPAGAIAVSAVSLNVQRSQPFASSANLSCRDLNLQLTVSRPTPESPSLLQVSGGVTLSLLGQTIPLTPILSSTGLIFRPATTDPASLPINGLGSVDLTTLEVGSGGLHPIGANRWDALEALYAFDEGSGSTVFDSAGIRTIDSREQVPLDLEIQTSAQVTRTATGISVSSGAIITSGAVRSTDTTKFPKIIAACRRSNALTIEAWVRTASTTLASNVTNPPRIVTFSKDAVTRNFTLSQGGIEKQEGGDFYGVRVRRTRSGSTDLNGLPPVRSRRGALTTQLSYVAFTRDANGNARFYVNGVEQSDPGQQVDMSGDFSQWDETLQVAIANELTRDRPWTGDIQRIAIYSRALSVAEVERSYFPSVRAQLSLANVPDPLDKIVVEWRESGDRSQLLYRPTAPLAITPELLLNNTSLTFELRAGNPTWSVTGTTQASLWGVAIGELVPNLTLNADGQPGFSFSRRQANDLPLALDRLGTLVLGAFELRATATGWQIPNTGQITFSVLPPPLRGALPAGLTITNGTLLLNFNPTPPLTLVEQLAFDQVNLQFQQVPDGWTVQGSVGLRLFGTSVSLVPSFATDDPNRPFTLAFLASPERPTGLTEPPGQLYLSRLQLRAITPTSNVLWAFLLNSFVELTGSNHLTRLGTLELGTDGQIVSLPGSGPGNSPGNRPGNNPGNNPNISQPSTQLQGRTSLKSLNDTLFAGDLQMRGDRFLSTGKFTLYPDGSPLRFNEDAQVEMGPQVQLRLRNPLTVNIPNFVLLNPQLGLTNGQFTLSGTWLGEALTLNGSQRAGQFVFQGQVNPSLPFSLNLGAIYEPNTSVKLTDFLKSPQSPRESRSLGATVQVEVSSGGVLANLAGQFQAEDSDGQVQDVTMPQFTVFSLPPNRNALLGLILDQLSARTDEIIAPQFRQGSSYRFTTAEGRSLVSLSSSGGLPAAPIVVTLPFVFAAASQTVSDASSLFRLEQTAEGCHLTMDVVGKSGGAIATAYRDFLAKLAAQENPSKALLPGAIALLKRQIAERLPMPIEQVLFYYYGMDTSEGVQVDLQPGMRLRVDFQNYQDVPPTERTAIALNGFVGSGTSYYHVHSYPNPAAPGQYLLGFDPFVSRIPVLIQTDASREGAGSLIDIQKPGFRFPYYRLFYPNQFSNLAAPRGSERTITLVGAASLVDLEAATDQYRKNGSVQTSENRIGFFFRGRVMVIPEIAIFVQEQPVYVSLGTTLRQVVERFQGIPVSAASNQSLGGFQGMLRSRRLIHTGVNSSPTYRFIELDTYTQYPNGIDVYDLPVVQGDRFYL